jgi:hypothetical protein
VRGRPPDVLTLTTTRLHGRCPGRPLTVEWEPCSCAPAREATADGRDMGHLVISCGNCHDELRSTTCYEPLHDIRHRQAGPWLASQGRCPLPRLHAGE